MKKPFPFALILFLSISLFGCINNAVDQVYPNPELLFEWLSDPQNAPGRVTSSPWPDHIEILSIDKVSGDAYEVQGEIIEITSVEEASDGVAAKRLISAVILGAYEQANSTMYVNAEFGFSFSLPTSWKGHEIVPSQWEGYAVGSPQGRETTETGPMITMRHPQWTLQNQRQDIPIMILTIAQWNLLQAGGFHIGAAPVGPSELGRNDKYVFALPPRYNYAFPPGYEEVESVLASNPLRATEAHADRASD